ncbi:DUF3103 family protein, partial [Xanthovirga aplysinae]|uniref:DUF3103 family protein n=1 Tax=Xanthovirga aplysinae TaxID=2529853 RepID=UPI0012BC8C34
ASSCHQEEVVTPNDLGSNSQEFGLDKNQMAIQVSQLLKDQANLSNVIPLLEQNRGGIKLSQALEKMENKEAHGKSFNTLMSMVEESLNKYSGQDAKIIEVPELWLHKPSTSFELDEILIAFVPEVNQKELDKIPAYNLKQEVVYLDPNKAPDKPVIVVETDGFEAFKIKVEHINQKLQENGLQKEGLNTGNKKTLSAEGFLETTVLNSISIADTKEEWYKGASEIYAVTSGIYNVDENNPQINVIAMQYIADSEQTYYPNQIVLVWDDYDYQAANIQFFEQDSNYNYQDLATVLVDGVFEITGLLTDLPWITALGRIANAIIQAIPEGAFTDGDDYVDSFYTVQKDMTYTNWEGVGGNAKISISPLNIAEN